MPPRGGTATAQHGVDDGGRRRLRVAVMVVVTALTAYLGWLLLDVGSRPVRHGAAHAVNVLAPLVAAWGPPGGRTDSVPDVTRRGPGSRSPA